MNTRFKALRTALNLTMDKFGERIGVSKSAVSQLEKGINNPGDQTLKLIISEFNVNEDWLLSGRGEMFEETKTDYITSLAKKYNLNTFDIRIVESYLSLDEDSREVIRKYIRSLSTNGIDKMKAASKSVEELETEYKKTS